MLVRFDWSYRWRQRLIRGRGTDCVFQRSNEGSCNGQWRCITYSRRPIVQSMPCSFWLVPKQNLQTVCWTWKKAPCLLRQAFSVGSLSIFNWRWQQSANYTKKYKNENIPSRLGIAWRACRTRRNSWGSSNQRTYRRDWSWYLIRTWFIIYI